MSEWALWAVMLVAQNAAFTWVSRARNSGSITYHALASVASNGIWIASMYFVVDMLRRAETWQDKWTVGVFYTTFTVIGSLFMHWFAMRYLETGKRKVGA